MDSSSQTIPTSESVTLKHLESAQSNPMIPGVGTLETGDDHGQLSTLTEEVEDSSVDQHRNSDVGLLADSNVNSTENDDEDIPTSIHAIEGAIPMSEMGDEEESRDGGYELLPSVVFMIPLPPPVNGRRSKSTTPFMLYTPPRSVYDKPPKKENGKRESEKLCKKLVRHYQQEVRFGEKIKRKEVPKTGKFYRLQKIRGSCIRGASMLTKWLPSTCVETLARLPPKRKLGEVVIFYPPFSGEARPEGEDQPYQPTEEEFRHDIDVLLRRTRRRVLIRLVIATAFMPIAAGIDFFAPAFSVEITLAYLAFQVYGFRKVNALTSAPKKKKSKKSKKVTLKKKNTDSAFNDPEVIDQNTGLITDAAQESSGRAVDLFRITPGDQAVFDPILRLMYDICHRIDPLTFPAVEEEPSRITEIQEGSSGEEEIANAEVTASATPPKRTQLGPTLHKPGPEVVRELMIAFRANLPEHLQDRHILDEERISEDLARYMKKAATEYVSSLKDRPERSPYKVTKKWFAKRKTVRQERSIKRKLKAQIKVERAEEEALLPTAEVEDATSGEANVPSELPNLSPEVASEVVVEETKEEKKERLAREKKEAKDLKHQQKQQAREEAMLAKQVKQEAKKAKKKVD